MISIDKKAPAFKLFDQNGKLISLKDYLCKNVILYFYPKDDTSGCTAEACSFRDDFSLFKNVDAVILGVSPDSIASHKKFQQKYSLPFTLLSDESKEVVEKYGVWKEKSMYGRKYMGVERTTIIIDKKGVVRKIYPKVKVAGHNEEVLTALDGLADD
ncbi:MAG: thioredoxin-dependent thiol peroxidase [Ignavibacteriales bacterium]|nr:thioredoxin-dependent thiol peroxidase [Ignavibacteriales bacterium]